MASTALADRMRAFSQPNSGGSSDGYAGHANTRSSAVQRWGAALSAHDMVSKVNL